MFVAEQMWKRSEEVVRYVRSGSKRNRQGSLTCPSYSTSILIFDSLQDRIEYRTDKHTVSIAKAIQVPHRPQQIPICNHNFGALFNKEQQELLYPLTRTKIDAK